MFYTHVNRGVIDSNRKHGTDNPAITIRKGKNGKSTYATEVLLPEGSRMVYSAHEPILRCGARLVIISKQQPEIIR